MFNSKYIGSEVEQLLDQVSGKTVYTAGSGITISDEGVISAEGGSGGGVDKESIDSIEKTVSSGLYDLNAKIRDRYTKAESDGKYQPKGNYLTKSLLTNKYYDNDYIDSRLRVISAALNELSDRIAALEGTNNKVIN